MSDQPVSVFASYERKAWPYRFEATLQVRRLCGGIPSDPRVVEGWLRANLGATNEQLLQEQVAQVMVERGVSAQEAQEEVAAASKLVGFKRDLERGLYVEGRQVKSAFKEWGNIRWPFPHKWGRYANARGNTVGGKATRSFFAEHLFVLEERLYLGVHEPSGVDQRFVHTFQGSSIVYSEYVEDAKVKLTVGTDHKFTDEEWGLLWSTGELEGLGANRSQGYGTFKVTSWEPVGA